MTASLLRFSIAIITLPYFPNAFNLIFFIIDIFLAAFLAAIFVCLLYCLKKVCPRVDMYTPLELDEIRLDRAQDREGVLLNKIDSMKVMYIQYSNLTMWAERYAFD